MSVLSPHDFQIALVILLVVPILVTIVRLSVRYRSAPFWWDDYMAILGLGLHIMMIVCMWLISLYFTSTVHFGRSARMAIYLVSSVGFVTATWCARLCILFILMRIVPGPRYRSYITACAFAFVAACLAVNLVAIVICQTTHVEWQTADGPPQCPVGRPEAILEIVCDTISDAVLIFIPVHIIMRTSSLSKGLRVRLVATFATSLTTTVVCIIHGVFLIRVGGLKDLLAAALQTSTALVVCSIPIIAPLLLRKITHDTDFQGDCERVSSLRWATHKGAGTIATFATDTTATTAGSSTAQDLEGQSNFAKSIRLDTLSSRSENSDFLAKGKHEVLGAL